MKKRKQAGDTIVEVLLALVILAMTIGMAYAIASKSIKRSQQAQERTQATKLVEGQIDKLKYLSESQNVADITTFGLATDTTRGLQCIDSTTVDESGKTVVQAVKLTDSIGDLCNDIYDIFDVAFSYNATSNLFTVSVNWDSISGSGNENVTMEYRVIQ